LSVNDNKAETIEATMRINDGEHRNRMTTLRIFFHLPSPAI
jgi:hypothetical protein